ncbi:MAG TPA: flagellar hook-associated protein FlgL [Clostridiales bacterium]|nr:flagellar hook-associated protein FlgL [Clostridiales bacterium]
MRINHNISAMNTYRQYNINSTSIAKSMEKLSSGYRINRAADDAAGLSISEKMRSQIRGLRQAIRNAQDGISFIQTAEGALTEVSDMLTRLKELAVQVQNGTYSEEDKANIGAEMKALGKAISDIYVNTKFNGIQVFGKQEVETTTIEDVVKNMFVYDGGNYTYLRYTEENGWQGGTYNSTAQKIEWEGVNNQIKYLPENMEADTIYKLDVDTIKEVTVNETDGSETFGNDVTFDDLTLTALKTSTADDNASIIKYGEDGKQFVEIKTATTNALNNLTKKASIAVNNPTLVTVDDVEAAISEVNTTRAAYGALQNQLEHASNNMATTRENLQAAESRIRDVDMAEEMMEYTKNNILLQAAQAMLAQANAQPQGILQLLQ